jgi:hypothetical protein
MVRESEFEIEENIKSRYVLHKWTLLNVNLMSQQSGKMGLGRVEITSKRKIIFYVHRYFIL